MPSGIADQLWYGVSVVALCPWIAVLGAQRPGVRVWNAFVLIPLIAVLMWPAATLWFRGHVPADFRLELPMVIGYGLVLVMGAGNYLGTAFAPAATLVIASQILLLVPATPLVSEQTLSSGTARLSATPVCWLPDWSLPGGSDVAGLHRGRRTTPSGSTSWIASGSCGRYGFANGSTIGPGRKHGGPGWSRRASSGMWTSMNARAVKPARESTTHSVGCCGGSSMSPGSASGWGRRGRSIRDAGAIEMPAGLPNARLRSLDDHDVDLLAFAFDLLVPDLTR